MEQLQRMASSNDNILLVDCHRATLGNAKKNACTHHHIIIIIKDKNEIKA